MNYTGKRCKLRDTVPIRLGFGAIALAFMLTAEMRLTTRLSGRSLSEHIASRDTLSGDGYLFMLLLFALMPALLRRQDRR